MKTHVLTGAGSGIGRAVAERLRDRGDRVVLLLRDADRINDLRPDFPQAVFIAADLAQPASLQGLGQVIGATVDSLLHIAGVVDLGSIDAANLATWQRQMDVNLTAPTLLTRELLPSLRAAGGLVVFVNSTAGLASGPGWSAYAASKFGLRAVADSLRAEEQSSGVRVTTIYPSRTATPMQEKVHEQEGVDYDPARWIQPETVAETILHILDLPADATIPDVTLRPATPSQ
jgi:NADP-dependent 3-hydroxy acid dehydrogenase YdfG